jgi:hypothetical protein
MGPGRDRLDARIFETKVIKVKTGESSKLMRFKLTA